MKFTERGPKYKTFVRQGQLPQIDQLCLNEKSRSETQIPQDLPPHECKAQKCVSKLKLELRNRDSVNKVSVLKVRLQHSNKSNKIKHKKFISTLKLVLRNEALSRVSEASKIQDPSDRQNNGLESLDPMSEVNRNHPDQNSVSKIQLHLDKDSEGGEGQFPQVVRSITVLPSYPRMVLPPF